MNGITSDEYMIHLIIYAKDWYASTNTMDDIRQIQSGYCGMEPKYIDDEGVMLWVTAVYEKFVPATRRNDLGRFLNEMFKDLRWVTPKRTELRRVDVVEKLLSDIRQYIMAKDIPVWPEPNPEILPLKDKDILVRWRENQERRLTSVAE